MGSALRANRTPCYAAVIRPNFPVCLLPAPLYTLSGLHRYMEGYQDPGGYGAGVRYVSMERSLQWVMINVRFVSMERSLQDDHETAASVGYLTGGVGPDPW